MALPGKGFTITDQDTGAVTDVNAYPVHSVNTSGLLKRVEAVLTPAQLRSRFLKGFEPIFRQFGIEYTDAELKDRINLAINEIELELKTVIFPEPFANKLAFEISSWQSWNYLRSENRPIQTITSLSIVGSDGISIYKIPAAWIELANAHMGQINVIPLLSAYQGVVSSAGGTTTGGLAFLASVRGGLGFVPAYWMVEGIYGISKQVGQVPIVVNTLIGIFATMDILSGIAALNIYNSVSLSQDGIGQSKSTAGPQIFVQRLQDLEFRKQAILKQVQAEFATKMFISNI